MHVCYRCCRIVDGKQVALKYFPSASSKYLNKVLKVLTQAPEHPTLIRYTAIVEPEGASMRDLGLYVEMPWYPNGSVVTWMGGRRDDGTLDPSAQSAQAKRLVALQMLRALAVLHGAGIAHRDIKPENMLMTDNGATTVLSDFEISRIDHGGTQQFQTSVTTMAQCGTFNYIAPELLRASGEVATSTYIQADMYSLGVTLHELQFGTTPPITINSKSQPTSDIVLPDDPNVGSHVRSLIKSLLAANPSTRPSAKDALGHSYFCEPIESLIYECVVCLQETPFDTGIECRCEERSKRHFYCDDCFEKHVQDRCEKIRSGGHLDHAVMCPDMQCEALPFLESSVVLHVSEAVYAELSTVRVALANTVANQKAQILMNEWQENKEVGRL